MKNTEEQRRIAELVRDAFADLGFSGFDFDVADIRLENGWWYVPVWPERDFDRLYECFGILAEVEVELQDKHDLKILLFPSEPPARKQE